MQLLVKWGFGAAIGIAAVIVIGTSAVVGAVHLTGDPTAAGWSKPVTGAVISQGFGCTPLNIEPYDPTCPSRHFHSGIDLAVASGTPVHAAGSGTVHIISSSTGFGLHVVIDHGDGLASLYGHLSTVTAGEGDVVSGGDVIGTVGSTGNSTGPHLHFEIDRDGIPENPQLDVALP